MRSSLAASAMVFLGASIQARASSKHSASVQPEVTPSPHRLDFDHLPTSHGLRRSLRRHRNAIGGQGHEKRLLGLLPDLTGGTNNAGDNVDDTSSKNDSGNRQGQTDTSASGPSSTDSGSRSGSSSSSSGQWTFSARVSDLDVITNAAPGEDSKAAADLSVLRRQLLSGVGDALGGVISGVGDNIGNALGGSGSSSSSSSSGSSGGGSSSSSSSSSSGDDDSSSGQNSGGSSSTGTRSKGGSQATPSTSSSSQRSSTGSRASGNTSPASSSLPNNASSGSASSAAALASSSVAAASQASSLSQSVAAAASADAASLASASINSAAAATQAATSSTPSAILVTSSLPSGTTVITSIASLAPNESAGTYAGGSGSGRTGASEGSNQDGNSNGSLSTAAIIGIVVPLGVIGLVVLIWTVVRRRQQARSRTLHPLDFAPAYGTADSPNAITRRSQESWLGGGRPMSGISDVEPDMMPPMEEMSHEDHLRRAGSHGGGFYDEGMALSMPPMSYSGAAAGRSVDGRGGSVLGSVDSHGLAYPSNDGHAEDAHAAAGYYRDHTADLHRGDWHQNTASEYTPNYRLDVAEPTRPQETYTREQDAYVDDVDSFAHAAHYGTELKKSSSRWSG